MGKSNSKIDSDPAAEENEENIDNKNTSTESDVDTNQPAENDDQPKEKTKKKGVAKGRLYVIIRHPVIEGTKYTPQQMEGLLLELQKRFSKHEIVLDVGRVDRYSGFVTFYNSDDPKKLYPKPRLMVDVLLYNIKQGCFQEMGPFPRVNIDMGAIRSAIQEIMDPESVCFIDFRQRPLYRERGMLPYEALLRL